MANKKITKTCLGCGGLFTRPFRPDRSQVYCKNSCRRITPIDRRFWQKVDVRGPDECWLWLGGVSGGYGQISLGKKAEGSIPAHCFSWILANGEDLGARWALHKCDVKLCVNPSHLFAGTSDDNIFDMVTKKRHAFGPKNGRAVIQTPDVVSIRAAAMRGENQDSVASCFGVSQSLVSAIKRGRNRRYEQE